MCTIKASVDAHLHKLHVLIVQYIMCIVATELLSVLRFSPGWFLNVYPADAHRGPDFSVNTEPDDGVSSSLQPLL